MNSFISEHRQKRIDGYKVSNLTNIKIGNIINFNYPSENNKNPHVLVLNPNWKFKLHGLVIDYITLLQLEKFKDFIISEAEEVEVNTPNTLQESLNVLSKTSQNPEVFYETRLKHYIKKYFSNISIYRTYKTISIRNLRLVNYNFNRNKIL